MEKSWDCDRDKGVSIYTNLWGIFNMINPIAISYVNIRLTISIHNVYIEEIIF